LSAASTNVEEDKTNKRLGRWLLLAGVVTLLAGLVALLAWGMVRSGGRPGGLGINSTFGEVPIEEKPARDFALQLFEGRTLALSELRGKVVMVDFWASWCPPCRKEAPELARVYREYQGRGIEFVGVDIWDSEDGAKDFIRLYSIPYPNGLDAKGKIAIDYGVTGIPEKYFISKDGVLLKKFIGPMNEGKLKMVLEELLDASAKP
jgi:cytochrome c biogenesis protein CcmG/thiol:disulfide interchange protein DsbE